ncbi:hypothetical protein [Rubrimonas sp.]|uniref:hypothetical protein n=1 Tax=Rubrimonas sp. TaxID=2036015 RepID=UPI002FDE2EBF
MRSAGLAAAMAMAAGAAMAGQADVLDARATREGDLWRFDVTVAHADEGWDHYADAWRVVGPDGTVFGERVLLHPHVDEQPFTRSSTGVAIPDAVRRVTIEARDSRHGWGGARLEIDLPR